MNFPQDTLAFHKNRALTKARSMENVPCSHIAPKIKAKTSEDFAHPEHDALWFYMMNHGMSEIGKRYALLEPLPKDVQEFVDHYYTEGAHKALRAMSYLMLICVRESRHLHNKDVIQSGMVEASCFPAWQYLTTVPDHALQAQQIFASTPPKCNVAVFVRGLAWQFYKGKYSGGYGGKKWGNVTDCLKNFVCGDSTAEVMLDTIWTLCHNGGPIFNKGVLYHHHNEGALQRILDVQRGGMIPQMIATDDKVQSYVDSNLKVRTEWLRATFPESTSGEVDFEQVMKLGSVGTYYAEVKQAKMSTPEYKAQKAAEQKAAEEFLAKQEKAKKEKFAKMYQVAPNVWVDKFQPVRQGVAA